ncbi:MAG: hypothetical protein LC104_02715 [Bacteroidales bacterium]|nr:hypothetical protein [Bacteroidales bacterium]
MADLAAFPKPRQEVTHQTDADSESVAERLHRLEQSLSRLENTEVLEKVVTQRVLERVQETAPDGFAPILPTDTLHTSAAMLALTGATPSIRGIWSKIPILAEFRLMFQMYFDHRYRLSRLCQLGIPIVVLLGIMNYFLFNWFFAIPLLGLICERVGLVILTVSAYKILARETIRYATVLQYLSRYGHY